MFVGSFQSKAGVPVTPTTAMQVAAVSACMRTIAETVGQLPFNYYRREGRGKFKETADPLYSLIHNAPNDFQTSQDWRETKTFHCLSYGNGYSLINRSRSGVVVEFLPLLPWRMRIIQDSQYNLSYVYIGSDGAQIKLPKDQVWRITGLSRDGINGISPISAHSTTIGIAIAADNHSALAFKNGAQLKGILKHPTKFKDDAAQRRVKETWDDATSGDNSYATAILEEGMDWMPASLSPKDLQQIETQEFSVKQIARIFRVQPHKIGVMDGAKFNNVEQQNTGFITDTMLPWFKRWEQSFWRDVLTKEQKKNNFAEILVLGLMRGDAKARSEYYDSGTMWGRLSPNDCRELENQNPRPDGDFYLTPLNMESNLTQKRNNGEGNNNG